MSTALHFDVAMAIVSLGHGEFFSPIMILWDHHCINGPSLTEMLCDAWLCLKVFGYYSFRHFFCFNLILFIFWDSNYIYARSFDIIPNINMQFLHFYSVNPSPLAFLYFVLCLDSSSLYCIRKLSLGREPGWKKEKNKSMILLICLQVHQLSGTSNFLLNKHSDFCFHFSYSTF